MQFAHGFQFNFRKRKFEHNKLAIKARKQKKLERQKELEAAHEYDKAKWQSFSNKMTKVFSWILC